MHAHHDLTHFDSHPTSKPHLQSIVKLLVGRQSAVDVVRMETVVLKTQRHYLIPSHSFMLSTESSFFMLQVHLIKTADLKSYLECEIQYSAVLSTLEVALTIAPFVAHVAYVLEDRISLLTSSVHDDHSRRGTCSSRGGLMGKRN